MQLLLQYIQDRLYLASYTHTPDATTPFPYPKQSASPSKRSARAQAGPTATGPKAHPPVYFSIDKTLLYNAFHGDFGPLHIGHLYRFAVQLHEVLGDPANEDRAVVFWSSADSRSKRALHCRHIAHTDKHRSRECRMHSGLLHGAHSVMATASCSSSHCADGPTLHAVPRCRLQPG